MTKNDTIGIITLFIFGLITIQNIVITGQNTDIVKLQIANKHLIQETQNLMLKQLSYLDKKTILCWNNETKKVETLSGETWEIFDLVIYDSPCEENFK